MSDIIECKYCKENKYEKVEAIKIIYKYKNPEAYGFPEIVHWDRTYDTNCCPICGRKIKE